MIPRTTGPNVDSGERERERVGVCRLPGPDLRVSMKLLMSLPMMPHLRPSPEQATLDASTVELTVTFSGQPFTWLPRRNGSSIDGGKQTNKPTKD